MSTIQVNSIVDIPGTGAPDFPNGLTSTGNVGIGISSPASALDVVGSGNFNAPIYCPVIVNSGTVIGQIAANAGGSVDVRAVSNHSLTFFTNNTQRMLIDSGGTTNFIGNAVPQTTNLYDLGTSALRWRNIYTQDLHLSNGIGDYTVVEGEEDLFLVNNKTGKSFKFALIEVDPKEVPPKSDV